MTTTADVAALTVDDAEEFFLASNATTTVREARLPSGFPDPYPVFKEYHGRGGVVEGDLDVLHFGAPFSMASLMGEDHVYTAVRYDEVARVLADYESFTSSAMEPVLGLGRAMIVVDPPEHKRHRLVVQHVFSRRAMDGFRTSVIEPVVVEGLDRLERDGGAEMMTGFINEFPMQVIGRILGLPQHNLDHVMRLAEGMLLLGDINPMVAMWAFDRIGTIFAEVVKERRAAPADDVISLLCTAEVEGESLTVDEVNTFLRILLPAGNETTFRATGNMLIALLTHREQLEMVRADRSLIPRVVDETLRWENPVNGPARVARHDVEIGGSIVPEGAAVQVSILSANHDERRFTDRDPELFDMTRTPEPHIAFGFGPHLCLGSHLAKMEMQAALSAFLDRYPRLRLDDEHPPPTITGSQTRNPSAIHVRWD